MDDYTWVKIAEERIEKLYNNMDDLMKMSNEDLLSKKEGRKTDKLWNCRKKLSEEGILSARSGIDSALKYMKPRIEGKSEAGEEIKLVNAYPGDARYIVSKRAPLIAEKAQEFYEELFRIKLESDEKEYEDLLKSGVENLPEGELRDAYEQQLFLKKYFGAESPNEVTGEDLRGYMRAYSKSISNTINCNKQEEMAYFLEYSDEFFPEHGEELFSERERLAEAASEFGNWDLMPTIYRLNGDEELVKMTKPVAELELVKLSPEFFDVPRIKGREDNFPSAEELPLDLKKRRRNVWLNLGITYDIVKEDYEKALKCFDKAISFAIEPEQINFMKRAASAQLNIADEYFDGKYRSSKKKSKADKKATKEYIKAVKRYKEIEKTSPEDVDSKLAMAYAYGRMGVCRKSYSKKGCKAALKEAKRKFEEALKFEKKFNQKQKKSAEKLRDALYSDSKIKDLLGI